MKISVAALSSLAGIAIALPQGSVSNELSGPCKKVTLVYARASTEVNNMGTTNSVGPGLCKGLKAAFSGEVACQGVGTPDYTAGLGDNVTPSGTTASAVKKATQYYTDALTRCPNTVIVSGGFSQGTAVIFNAVSKAPAEIRNKIAGVVLYGYTKNAQNKGQIPNYPPEKLKVFCPKADGVCGGQLNVNAGHFAYLNDGTIKQGTEFLIGRIKAAGTGAGAATSEGA